MSSVAYATQEILHRPGPGRHRVPAPDQVGRARRRDRHGSRSSPPTGRTCTPTPAAAATTRSPTPTSAPKFGLVVAERAAGRLRPDRRGVDLGRRGEPRLDPAVLLDGRPQGRRRRWPSSRSSCCSTCAGIRESGVAFAIPTYAFMFGIMSMIAVGHLPAGSTGADLQAVDARSYGIQPELHDLGTAGDPVPGAARVRLRLYGADRRRGDQQRRARRSASPSRKNAANTLALMGGIAVTMFVGVTFLAIQLGVKITESNADAHRLPRQHPAHRHRPDRRARSSAARTTCRSTSCSW